MLLLIGTGPMAIEYAKVLKAQNQKFTVIGRGVASADAFTAKTGIPVLAGGLYAVADSGFIDAATSAIVAVGVEALFETTLILLNLGVKKILLEKPGVMYPYQIRPLCEAVEANGARVFIAYNRRFLSSVRGAREIIEADGGLTSFTFDFTEWGHEIETLIKAPGVKENWVLSNSSHVLDLAFHLGGIPKIISTSHAGSLDWHPSAAVFVGSGVSVKNIPFSYHADWSAPGRWGLEFSTLNNKIIFRPMEKLHVMRKGSVQIEEVTVNKQDVIFDTEFKPGLYRQAEAFFSEEYKNLCDINELRSVLEYYCAIAGYSYARD